MSTEETERPHKAGAFDIRIFIGTLLGIYALVLLAMGLVGTSDADLDRSGGFNVNLATGIGLAVATAVLFVWARLRPVVVRPDEIEDYSEPPRSRSTES